MLISVFDAVVASEIVEHVADVDLFVGSCVRLARKGAPLFFTTINQTVASYILAIWIAEVSFIFRHTRYIQSILTLENDDIILLQRVLGLVPAGIHVWSKFVKPESLRAMLESKKCKIAAVQGMGYNPFNSHWFWIENKNVNYALIAKKC